MLSTNADVQLSASIDGATSAEPMLSGFIPVGTASSLPSLGVTAKSFEEMNEKQLAAQVCFSSVGWREI